MLLLIGAAILGFFIEVGNILTILSVLLLKSMRKKKYILITSLAIADSLIGLLPMLFVYEYHYSFIFKQREEPAHLIMIMTFAFLTNTSSWHLAAMSLDRYFAIRFPIFYRANATARRLFILATASWILGFLAALSYLCWAPSSTTRNTTNPCHEFNSFTSMVPLWYNFTIQLVQYVIIALLLTKLSLIVLATARANRRRPLLGNENASRSFKYVDAVLLGMINCCVREKLLKSWLKNRRTRARASDARAASEENEFSVTASCAYSINVEKVEIVGPPLSTQRSSEDIIRDIHYTENREHENCGNVATNNIVASKNVSATKNIVSSKNVSAYKNVEAQSVVFISGKRSLDCSQTCSTEISGENVLRRNDSNSNIENSFQHRNCSNANIAQVTNMRKSKNNLLFLTRNVASRNSDDSFGRETIWPTTGNSCGSFGRETKWPTTGNSCGSFGRETKSPATGSLLKGYKLVATIILFYLVTWAFYFVIQILRITEEFCYSQILRAVFVFSGMLVAFNSGVNFLVYAWANKEFRYAYKSIITCSCRSNYK